MGTEITDGLVSVNIDKRSVSPKNYYYWVMLTPKGKMLVEAWLKADKKGVENTMAQQTK